MERQNGTRIRQGLRRGMQGIFVIVIMIENS